MKKVMRAMSHFWMRKVGWLRMLAYPVLRGDRGKLPDGGDEGLTFQMNPRYNADDWQGVLRISSHYRFPEKLLPPPAGRRKTASALTRVYRFKCATWFGQSGGRHAR